jgi:hypothetical protein
MMNAVEVYDAQDLLSDLEGISDLVRFEYHDELVADNIDKACDTLAFLLERLRTQVSVATA